MPKKIENKAAAATAPAGNKKAATLHIELISTPQPASKSTKTAPKKPEADVTPAPAAKKTKAKPAPQAAAPSIAPAPSIEAAPEPPVVPAPPVEAAPEPPIAAPPVAAADPIEAAPAPEAKKKRAATKTSAEAAKTTSAAAAKTAKPNAKAGKAAKPAKAAKPGKPIADPIGDVSDGEARTTDSATPAPPTLSAVEDDSSEEPDYLPQAPPAVVAQPPAKLERLQKILAKAGIASRRRAEEMIIEGRVIVNGQVVTQLGAKADLGRDHIRVDGKLLAGAERHRYFVLNKPRGFVTTVSDPEHRPTVMQFFESLNERLYPVGRLDYLSEGLLLVTNDGELANQLTRASLGVEKTYLVKVAGKPTEEELDRLRSGVSIERTGPGSERVGTAPATIRQVRQGDNPWYEVVLIEGRNRELRKMFEQIGHFVEKIRRVGYGPLVLDVEPGQFRELTAEEVKALQLTAEGKLKPRRQRALPTVPKETIRAAGERPFKSSPGKTFGSRPPASRSGRSFDGPPRDRTSDSRPPFKPRFDNRGSERFGGRAQSSGSSGEPRDDSRSFKPARDFSKPFRKRDDSTPGREQRFEASSTGFRPQQRNQDADGDSSARREFGPRSDRPQFSRGPGQDFNRPPRQDFQRGDRPAFRPGAKPDFNRGGKPAFNRPARPAFDRSPKPDFDSGSKPVFPRSAPGAPLRDKPSTFRSDRPSFDRGSKPAFGRGAKPAFDRPSRPSFDRGGKPPFERGSRPAFKSNDRPSFKRDDKPSFGSTARPPFKRSSDSGGSFEARPPRPAGRTFGARPAGKPAGRPSGGKFSGGSSSGRKFSAGAPRKSGSRPAGKFKPRTADRKRKK